MVGVGMEREEGRGGWGMEREEDRGGWGMERERGGGGDGGKLLLEMDVEPTVSWS